VLIGLANRIYYQDRELAAKHAADQRRAAVDCDANSRRAWKPPNMQNTYRQGSWRTRRSGK
jgi:hypothetical protein